MDSETSSGATVTHNTEIGWQGVTFYTPDYEDVALRLGQSCQAHGVPMRLEHMESTGSWVANCALKPLAIQRAMSAFRKPIVWIDADAVVRGYPNLFDRLVGSDYDFACHFRTHNPKRERELLSGTLFFNTTKNSMRLIDRWVAQQDKCKDHWDQHTLHHVVKQMPELKVFELPASYTQIFDTMKHNGTPVIEHFQESRKHKK